MLAEIVTISRCIFSFDSGVFTVSFLQRCVVFICICSSRIIPAQFSPSKVDGPSTIIITFSVRSIGTSSWHKLEIWPEKNLQFCYICTIHFFTTTRAQRWKLELWVSLLVYLQVPLSLTFVQHIISQIQILIVLS